MNINQLLKKIAIIFLFFAPNITFAQLGINSDNSAPHGSSMLDVKSSTKGVLLPRVASDLASPAEGLLYYNTTGHNFRYYDGTAWQNALFGQQWNVNGTHISYSLGNVGIGTASPVAPLNIFKNTNSSLLIQNTFTGNTAGDGLYLGNNNVDGKAFLTNFENASLGLGTNGLERVTILSTGNVGIGTTTPDQMLTVNGSARIVNSLAINDNFPDYNLDVNGTAGIEVLGVGITPDINYPLKVGGIANLNNLLVNGTANVNGTLNANGNLAVDGTATVNGGGGVAYNLLNSNNIKIARFVTPQPAVWGTSPAQYPIPAHGFREITIDLPAGFTSTPAVMVASQHSSGGISGELYRAILVIYNCNTTQCTGKIINTDSSPIDYWVRWNLVAMQF